MNGQPGHFIGLMSGTSLDGVDGVLAHFDKTGQPSKVSSVSMDMPGDLCQELLLLNSPGDNEIHRCAVAANTLSDLYAEVVHQLLTQTGLRASDITAIGAHGQTVRHRPDLGYTTQLLAPARLAEHTQISVIADLRSRDVAAGGQGAPLVPAFHRAVFGQNTPRVILNLGGIANVTLLRPGQPVIGFDTGPANLLLDLWCARHTGKPFDDDGQWAASGAIHSELLGALLDSDPWFAAPPPKSTGRDQFNAQWLDERLNRLLALPSGGSLRAVDVQATLTALTAHSVTDALTAVGASDLPIFACGGGARNGFLLSQLASLHRAPVGTTMELGVNTQDMEALAFAWLAWAHINKNAGNLPEVTGAGGARILGAYWPA